MSQKQCCGIGEVFNDRHTRKMLRRFRRRGPDKTTRILIDELQRVIRADDRTGLTLLDIGAGIGAIHHELLNGAITRATHVDASPAHLVAAREETERRGHSGAVDFLEGDFTAMVERIPEADIVTLDRVICCFDDMERLVRRSAEKARRFYGAVYPRKTGWMRGAGGLINLVQWVQRSPFRFFVHDPHAIDGVLRSEGLHPLTSRQTLGWHAVIYARSS
jgi:magnesium-protoporphyrin O-methyltransferase